jgi:hypothetical protein
MLNQQFAEFLRKQGFTPDAEGNNSSCWTKRLAGINKDLIANLRKPWNVRWIEAGQTPIWEPIKVELYVSPVSTNKAKVSLRGHNKAIALFEAGVETALMLYHIYSEKDRNFKKRAQAILNGEKPELNIV